jgi:uncharacterized membrane protein
MKIEILEFVDGARNAKGVAVIIDVFRAFSVACYAVDAGAVRIIATSEVSEAFKLKKKYKNSVREQPYRSNQGRSFRKNCYSHYNCRYTGTY